MDVSATIYKYIRDLGWSISDVTLGKICDKVILKRDKDKRGIKNNEIMCDVIKKIFSNVTSLYVVYETDFYPSPIHLNSDPETGLVLIQLVRGS